MVKRSQTSKSKPNTRPSTNGDGGSKDIFGYNKPIIKGQPNNTVYAAAALVGAGLLYFAYENGWLNSIFGGGAPSLPPGVVVAVNPNPIQQGGSGVATGSFNPPVPTAYYAVYDSTGKQVLNGTLGTNVSSYNTALLTQSLPIGTYSIIVQDTPVPPTSAPTTGSQVLGTNTVLQDNWTPTAFTKNQSAAPGEGISGPSSITLG